MPFENGITLPNSYFKFFKRDTRQDYTNNDNEDKNQIT